MTAPADQAAASAFWIDRPGVGAVRPVTLPARDGDQALVRTAFSAVSLGTERLVFSGRVPPSLYDSMRVPFQDGAFPGPVKYGYAAVGVVEAGPPALVGRRVFCLHPHQTRFVVPAAALVPVPDSVPADRAVLAANAETAVNALWDARLLPGQTVSVIGAGVVGALVAILARRLTGVEVELIDIDPERRVLADAFGLGFATPETARRDRAVVFHATGVPAGLVSALELAGFEGLIVELSWYGTRPVTLPLGEAFHVRRLRLIASQVGHVAPAQRGRFRHADRLAFALRHLDDPGFDRLITHEIDFFDLPAWFAGLDAPGRSPGTVRVRYGAADRPSAPSPVPDRGSPDRCMR